MQKAGRVKQWAVVDIRDPAVQMPRHTRSDVIYAKFSAGFKSVELHFQKKVSTSSVMD